MARKIKTKYTLRKDGRIMATKTYDGNKKCFYGHSDAEIDKQIADYEANKAAGRDHNVRTFEKVADEWWAKKEPKLSPNSITGYVALKNRAVDEFGKLPVDQITAQHIYTWLNRLAAKDYSQKVIGNSRSVVKQVLDEAFIAGDIQSNPCVSVPVVKGKPKAKRKPTPEEDIKKIEKTKTLNNFARMTYFMLFTGCRRGEAAALQQKHINREKKMATICQSIAYSNTRKPVIKPPKTEAGIREVDLYDNVLEILPEYDDPETYVFFPDGLPTKTALESGLKKYQTENGLTSTAHQLRHAYATMGHAAHIDPKDMQHRLGHSSIAMTMDIYTDLDNKYNSEVRNKFNDYIQNEVMKKTSCQRVVNETETD